MLGPPIQGNYPYLYIYIYIYSSKLLWQLTISHMAASIHLIFGVPTNHQSWHPQLYISSALEGPVPGNYIVTVAGTLPEYQEIWEAC